MQSSVTDVTTTSVLSFGKGNKLAPKLKRLIIMDEVSDHAGCMQHALVDGEHDPLTGESASGGVLHGNCMVCSCGRSELECKLVVFR